MSSDEYDTGIRQPDIFWRGILLLSIAAAILSPHVETETAITAVIIIGIIGTGLALMGLVADWRIFGGGSDA